MFLDVQISYFLRHSGLPELWLLPRLLPMPDLLLGPPCCVCDATGLLGAPWAGGLCAQEPHILPRPQPQRQLVTRGWAQRDR